MQKEIGSNFDLNPESVFLEETQVDLKKYGLQGSDVIFLSTGRSAEGMVLDEIERRNPNLKKKALIPPFTCHTVIEPFLQRNYKIETYTIDRSFSLDMNRFGEELIRSRAQVVLVHAYFGFNTIKGIEQIRKEASEKGIIFIEDRTQCLYSGFPTFSADYTIGSLRKWSALPDGGYALCKEGKFSVRPEEYDMELEKEKLTAFGWKYDYLHKNLGEKQRFLEKFQVAENILDSQRKYYKISPSSAYLQEHMDVKRLKEKRRENYSYILHGIENMKGVSVITPPLNETDVPLYCPVYVDYREKLQKYLRFNRIYAPIVWPKADCCPEICKDVQKLYDHVLCIPIDQRYDLDDMERILKCIREYEDNEENSITES